MTQDTALQAADGSRLLRTLGQLGVLDLAVAEQALTAQLAGHINFSASIKLATALGKVEGEVFQPADVAQPTPRETFLRLRSTIVSSLLASFAAKPVRTHLKLPALEAQPPEDVGAAYAPYLRFYTGQQRMLEAKVQNLHLQVRDATAMLSPRLAQLCFLEAAMGDTLAPMARKAFSYTPRLLEQRFRNLVERYRAQASDSEVTAWTSWQQQFHGELRELLLAELEARLLPTLGLVEAINPEKANHENREAFKL